MVLEGDYDGTAAAANQIHYKSLRSLKKEEYKDDFRAKSCVEAVIGASKFQEDRKMEEDSKTSKVPESSWQMVTRRKNKKVKIDKWATIFLANIPSNTKAREVWGFFNNANKVLYIILLRKRDVNGNRIGFVKIESDNEALAILDRLGNNKFLGVKLDLKLELNKSKDKGSKSKEDTSKKEEVDEGKKTERFKSRSGFTKVPRQSDFRCKEEDKINDVELNSNYPTCFDNSFYLFLHLSHEVGVYTG